MTDHDEVGRTADQRDLFLYRAAYGPDELRERLESWSATDPEEFEAATNLCAECMHDLDVAHDMRAADGCAGCSECGTASEIVSVCGVNPRCDICGKTQQPEDDWNGETGNHLSCERTYVRAWVEGARHG
jgi:hypothetical protein